MIWGNHGKLGGNGPKYQLEECWHKRMLRRLGWGGLALAVLHLLCHEVPIIIAAFAAYFGWGPFPRMP